MDNKSHTVNFKVQRLLRFGLLLVFLLTSCSGLEETATPSPTPELTHTISNLAEVEIPSATFEPTHTQSKMELLEFGSYHTGKSTYELIDTSRNNRSVNITIFYPALSERETHMYVEKFGEPDFSSAPYPAILSSTKVANQFAPYLVSHGFTWIGVNDIDTYMKLNEEIYQQPLDLLFALNQVTENPPAGLEGMINTDVVGSIGYSFDGNNSLSLSGARINSSLYLSNCADLDNLPDWGAMSCFSCDAAQNWETFTSDAEKVITIDGDGIWQALTDQRIKAFMPLATEGIWLFDLSLIDRPILMIAGSEDPLYRENVLIFEDLPAKDKTFITFLNEDHMMIFDSDVVAQLAYFATAFFGYHLQGYENYQVYFSEDFISNLEGFVWGTMSQE
jgi:hypothetical protein